MRNIGSYLLPLSMIAVTGVLTGSAHAAPGDVVVHVVSKPIQMAPGVSQAQILTALRDPNLILRYFSPPSDGVAPTVTRLSSTSARLEMPIKVSLWPLGERIYGIAADMSIREMKSTGSTEFACAADEVGRQVELNTQKACLDLGRSDPKAITLEDPNSAAYTFAMRCSQFTRRIGRLAIQVCVGPDSGSGVRIRTRTIGTEGILAVDPEDQTKEQFIMSNMNSAVGGRIEKLQGNIVSAVQTAAQTIPATTTVSGDGATGLGSVPAH